MGIGQVQLAREQGLNIFEQDECFCSKLGSEVVYAIKGIG